MAKKVQSKQVKREKPVPEYKLRLVKDILEKIKSNKTILVASTKGLPASQFQKIKKSLRGKSEVVIAKKSILLRAVDSAKNDSLSELNKYIGDNVALFFSNVDVFELSASLTENQVSTKARTGDIAPEDITIEPGPTDLIPGPAISELSGVGLKVAVEGGKLAIKQGATVTKKGEAINEKVAAVLGKLNILPMKVGFIPVAAYDAGSKKVFSSIRVDKKSTLENLRESISKGFGFAVNIGYTTKETVSYFIMKAANEARVLEQKVSGLKLASQGGES
ncbi:MAG: 50S ribosomal protein L10 [Nanoarchaeota archaeon]|nr:50S ribosomal protein L10 [Nanoarchaeota archaeon]